MDEFKIKEAAERYVDGNYSHKYSGVQRTAAREGFLAGVKCGYRQATKEIASQFEDVQRKQESILHPEYDRYKDEAIERLQN